MGPTVEIIVAHTLVDHRFHRGIQTRMLGCLIGLDPIRFIPAGEVTLVSLCAAGELGQK